MYILYYFSRQKSIGDLHKYGTIFYWFYWLSYTFWNTEITLYNVAVYSVIRGGGQGGEGERRSIKRGGEGNRLFPLPHPTLYRTARNGPPPLLSLILNLSYLTDIGIVISFFILSWSDRTDTLPHGINSTGSRVEERNLKSVSLYLYIVRGIKSLGELL